MVLFYCTAKFFNYYIIKKEVKLSRPDVGSSNNRTFGSVKISNAIEVLFLSPPLIPFKNTPPI